MPKRAKRPVGFHFGLEFDGVIRGYFTTCSGLSSENEVTEYREGTEDASLTVRKLPGLKKFGNITLKRGITTDKSLWEWRQQVESGDAEAARKDGSIVMYDRKHKEVARWDFKRAWPAKISLLSPQADSTEIASEELMITLESIQRVS
jgi:phage tail-like protein